MRIEVSNRTEDGIISFKAETSAERLQLKWLLEKSKHLNLNVFEFAGWDDDGGGISFVTELMPKQ